MSIQSPSPVDLAIRAAVRGAGAALAAVFAITAWARHSKPLHPVGSVESARLTIRAPVSSSTPDPAARPSAGVALLDEPGEYGCVVRVSYAVGTGPERPDIEGFALRIVPGPRHPDPIDVLFASTGSGSLSRFGLTVRSPGVHRTQTTLLPIRTAGGRALVLRLEPLDANGSSLPRRYELSWAHGRGPWHPCGELTVEVEADEPDRPVRFDPVRFSLPGTAQYAVVAALREPAYGLSRRAWPRAGHLPMADGLRNESL